MAQHRRRPVFRPHEPTPSGTTRLAEYPGGRARVTFNRIIVTPTFAAGLGVVIAALLALPLAEAVFRSVPPGSHGQQCAAAGCGSGQTTAPGLGAQVQGSPGTEASARPGKRLPTVAARHYPQPSGASHLRKPQHRQPGQPILAYYVLHRWRDGYRSEIVVNFASGGIPATWLLRFSVPRGVVGNVVVSGWGQQYEVDDQHIVTDSFGNYSGIPPTPERINKLFFSVTRVSSPAAPDGCYFDHRSCGLAG